MKTPRDTMRTMQNEVEPPGSTSFVFRGSAQGLGWSTTTGSPATSPPGTGHAPLSTAALS